MTREEAIKRLEVVRTNALIQKANGASEYWQEEIDGTIEAIDMAIEALQTDADRPHGEWINREYCQVDEDAYEVATCSNCKSEITIEYPHDKFCPNCGARMKGGAE